MLIEDDSPDEKFPCTLPDGFSRTPRKCDFGSAYIAPRAYRKTYRHIPNT
jgi:hypothetical protein